MINEKNNIFKVEPIFKEHNDEFSSDSWVVFELFNDQVKVNYFNNKLHTKDFDSFEGFVDYVFDDAYFSKECVDEKFIKNGFASLLCYTKETDDSYNESKRKSEVHANVKAKLINIYNGDLTLDKINSIVNQMKSNLSNFIQTTEESVLDNDKLQRDPHEYYGLNKKLF